MYLDTGSGVICAWAIEVDVVRCRVSKNGGRGVRIWVSTVDLELKSTVRLKEEGENKKGIKIEAKKQRRETNTTPIPSE
jgi:hypothetical protein